MTTDLESPAVANATSPAPDTPQPTPSRDVASSTSSPAPTRDTAYLAALTTYVHSLSPTTTPPPSKPDVPVTTAALLTQAAQTGYAAPGDADLLADLAGIAAQSPTPDVLDATYRLAFVPGLPASAHPGLMYLLLSLGFQVDDYATVLGSYCVDVKYRGLVKRVVGEITDAPVATALLGGYRDKSKPEDDKAEDANAEELPAVEDNSDKVHEHDRLYHVEMDVSDEAWTWSWDKVKQIPGLATFMQV